MRLEKVATIGETPDSNSVVAWSSLARDSRGNFYVAPMARPGEIYVYGPDGKYRRRFAGSGQAWVRFGVGTLLAIDGADSIHIVDDDNQRWTVLGPDHRVARTVALPGFVRRFFVLDDGTLLTHADVGTPQCFGLPLQILSTDGTVERCFGGDDGVIRIGRPHTRMRQVADAGGGLIWSARVNRYEIELLDSLGKLRRRLVRETDWFAPWVTDAPGAFVTSPPRPRVMGISTASGGLLVVFVSVPDARWTPPPPGSPGPVTAEALALHFDSVVEVLDPLNGTLLASLNFRTQLIPTIGGSLAYSVAQTDSGDTRMDVWRVVIDARLPQHQDKEETR